VRQHNRTKTPCRGGSRTAPTTCDVPADPVVGSPGSAGVPRVQRTRGDATRKCAWFRRSRTLPAGTVGATRWVALGAHAGQRRRVTWDHRARSHQGDASRRPYMPCVQPRALHQRTSQHTRRTSGRGREDRLSRSPHPSEPCRRGSRTQLSGRWFTYTKDWQFRTWAVAEERNFGHARKFAQLEGGLLPQQTVGGQIRATEHSQNAQHDTNIGRSCQAAASNPPRRVNHDSGG
jgi:hypothetical protein